MEYKIIDILHTGKHGQLNNRKSGKHIDIMIGQIYSIDIDYYRPGETIMFMQNERAVYCSDSFIKSYSESNYIIIETTYSKYVLEKISD